MENFSPAIIALIHLLESRGFPRFSDPILLGCESTTGAKLELREADASVRGGEINFGEENSFRYTNGERIIVKSPREYKFFQATSFTSAEYFTPNSN